jgi:hypothetical protein
VQKSLLNPSLHHPPLVVISEEDEIALLSLTISYSFHYLYHTNKFSFFKFSPKIACQAPKPPNSLKQKEIELEV